MDIIYTSISYLFGIHMNLAPYYKLVILFGLFKVCLKVSGRFLGLS